MNKSVKHLTEISNIVNETMQKIEKGSDEKETLKVFNKSLDKILINIVDEFGGESYFFKANNYSAWQLAMGEVE